MTVWLISEFWGPKSPYTPGCWYCIEHPPDVFLDHKQLCIYCVGRWFPSWSIAEVWDWLERQAQEAVRLKEARQRSQGRQLRLIEV